jgi:hypothetical protein
VDKTTVDSDPSDEHDDSAHKAEELMEQAAYTPGSEGRLEWAQAFRKLADLGRDRREED